MGAWKRFVKDYFSFTRRDRIGILVLVVMIVFVAFVPAIVNRHRPSRFSDSDSSWIVEIEKNKQPPKEYKPYYPGKRFYEKPATHENLSPFDPNTATEAELKKLGLRDPLVQTILRYREKGGKFKKPTDLEKIYGMHKDEYERLVSYIRISATTDSHNRLKPFTDTGFNNPATNSNFKKEYRKVEINFSDTSAWIALPGIGNRYAKRILDFREKLGGFISVDQVGETFGLPDSVFQKIKPLLLFEYAEPRKININSATIDVLKSHPYIRWSIANAIIAYRDMHGPFKSVEEIKKIMAITDELFQKIAPYFSD